MTNRLPALRALTILLVLTLAPREVSAQTANLCDELAAHPNDPNRMAAGVVFDNIIPRPALAACQDAVKQDPEDPRFHYQLGRAYEASGQLPNAMQEYQLAAQKGYAAGYYNLGLKAEEKGKIHDARNYYSLASKGGMQIAAEMLARLTFNASQFSSPDLFDAIYNDTLQGGSGGLIVYMTGFMGMFYNSEYCRGVGVSPGSYARISQLSQQAAFQGFLGAMADTSRSGYEAGQALTAGFAVNVGNAEADAQKFFTAYGCKGPVADVFFRNLNNWAGSL